MMADPFPGVRPSQLGAGRELMCDKSGCAPRSPRRSRNMVSDGSADGCDRYRSCVGRLLRGPQGPLVSAGSPEWAEPAPMVSGRRFVLKPFRPARLRVDSAPWYSNGPLRPCADRLSASHRQPHKGPCPGHPMSPRPSWATLSITITSDSMRLIRP
jgi:hypothetical protein